MIRSIKISDFKSIKDVSISLGRVNLFIGANGSGKSNFLEAVGVLASSLARGIGENDLIQKGVRSTPPALMKSAFKNSKLALAAQIGAHLDHDIEYQIRITAAERDYQMSFTHETCKYQGRKVFGRGPNGIQFQRQSIAIDRIDKHRSLWDAMGLTYDGPAEVEQALISLSNYVIYAPQTEFLRGTRTSEVARHPLGLRGEGIVEALKVVFSQRLKTTKEIRSSENIIAKSDKWLLDRVLNLLSVPKWANSVRVGEIREELKSRALANLQGDMIFLVDRFMKRGRDTLSAYDSSEGMLFIVFLATIMIHPDAPKIFAVDNVDSGLNPFATKKVIQTMIDVTHQTASQYGGLGPDQIFLTSHNPVAMDAFDLFDNENKVFVVSRNAQGHTQIRALQPSPDVTRDDWEKLKGGRNLSELWISGRIEGALEL